MEPVNERVLFTWESGDINIAALNKMKSALQSFIDGPAFPPRHSEHRESTPVPWIRNGEGGIGLWKLELRDRHPELIRRRPPGRGTQYLYHATLKRARISWKVVAFEQERDVGPRETDWQCLE